MQYGQSGCAGDMGSMYGRQGTSQEWAASHSRVATVIEQEKVSKLKKKPSKKSKKSK
jgi:hypothetical protein